jgi:AbrB family looped-hinge helix DNA binding protein
MIEEEMDILNEETGPFMAVEKTIRAVFAVKVLRDGRVTIPDDQRKKLGIREGDWVKLIMEKMEE